MTKFNIGEVVHAEDDDFVFLSGTIYGIDQVTKDEPPLYLVRGNARIKGGTKVRYQNRVFWERELSEVISNAEDEDYCIECGDGTGMHMPSCSKF